MRRRTIWGAVTSLLRIALVTILALGLVVPVAAPASAWHEGCDPENPCDPRPHTPKELLVQATCYVKGLAGLPC